MTWQDIGSIVGALSGIAGLFFNWRTRAELSASRRPILSFFQNPSLIWPNGFSAKLRSRSNVGWKATRVRIIWPRAALIAFAPESGGKVEKSRSIDPRLTVTNAGRTSREMNVGPSDEGQARLLIFFPNEGAPRNLPFSFRVWLFVTLIDETGATKWRLRTLRFTFKSKETLNHE